MDWQCGQWHAYLGFGEFLSSAGLGLHGQIHWVLDDATSGVLWWLPSELGSLFVCGYLDGTRGPREAWQAGLEGRNLRPGTTATGVETGHTELVGSTRRQGYLRTLMRDAVRADSIGALESFVGLHGIENEALKIRPMENSVTSESYS